MRLTIVSLSALALSACATTPQEAPAPPERPREATQVPPSRPQPGYNASGFIAPQVMEGPGLAGIIRENASTLQRRFGAPRLDVLEGDARKLQFRGEACVLDIFLYPLAAGTEPVATWIEARRASDGANVDRLACIQALSAS